MNTGMVLLGIISVLSFVFSLYALVQCLFFERMRILAKDLDDDLAKLKRQVESMRKSQGDRIRALEAGSGNLSTTDLVLKTLLQNNGTLGQDQEVDDDDNPF